MQYIDTSAAYKLVIEEPESQALSAYLDKHFTETTLVASMLLHTELHCAVARSAQVNPDSVQDVLDSVTLVDVKRHDFIRAVSSLWGLRSSDALHLATAVRLGVEEMITYDREMAAAAERIGIRVVAPA